MQQTGSDFVTHQPAPQPLEKAGTTVDLGSLLAQLQALRTDSRQRAQARLQRSAGSFVHGQPSPSATNLAHYLALRQHDLRTLQEQLAGIGLSSLGRGEAHILDNLNSVVTLLTQLAGGAAADDGDTEVAVTLAEGQRILAEHTERLFGPAPSGRRVRIMVTLPGHAADDYPFIEALVAAGMD